jgi:hypothetical protein
MKENGYEYVRGVWYYWGIASPSPYAPNGNSKITGRSKEFKTREYRTYF